MTYGFVLLISLFAASGSVEEPVKTDKEKMQGKWQVRIFDNKSVKDKETYWEIEGNTITFCDSDHAVGVLFTLYPGKHSKWIRLMGAPDWRPGDACFEGHYTLATDTLTITYRFKDGRGSQHWGEDNAKEENGPHTIILKRASTDRR
jgi:uncharacterized protein (TIGR03067 family)